MTGTVIHQDARGVIAELAFERHALIAPHDNPNTTFFVVIGGRLRAGGRRAHAVNQGEAVVWPAGIAHGAYTDGTEMRAIVIELTGADDAGARGVVDVLTAGPPADGVTAAEGTLARPEPTPDEHDRSQGEPW